MTLLHRAGWEMRTHAGSWTPDTDSLTTFYSNRWHNVTRVFDANGRLTLVYCNLTTPTQASNGLVRWTDLDLDLLGRPDGSYQLLDAEEFADHARRWNYPAELQARVWSAAARLRRQADEGAGPFRNLTGTLADFLREETGEEADDV